MNRHEFFVGIPSMPQADRQLLFWAYDIVKKWHEKQKRDSGERYFEHLRGVVAILIAYGHTDPVTLALALLHDLLEDHLFPPSLLEQIFGHRIARYVVTLSKSYPIEDPVTGFMYRSKKLPTDVYFAGIAVGDDDPILVKCADRKYNQKDLLGDQPAGSRWTPEKCKKKIEETRTYVIPMAARCDPRFEQDLIYQCDMIERRITPLLAGK
jgi:(p)ppGpp synthase/HD superfamily hydrolase